MNQLTKRESEVLETYVENSMTAEQVAYYLDLSLKTVNNHLRAIRQKINAVSLVDMTNKYWKANYILIRKRPTEPAPAKTGKLIHFNRQIVEIKQAA